MAKSSNDSCGNLPEWFRSSNSVIGGVDFNGLVLLVLFKLDRTFPERLNLLDNTVLSEAAGEFDRVWRWLESQHIVSGPVTNSSLTLLGRESFRLTLKQMPDIAAKLSESGDQLSSREAKRLMLSFLRLHYHRSM